MIKKPAKLILLLFISAIIASCNETEKFYFNEGYIFGTSYHISYQANQDCHVELVEQLNLFNKSLSTYDKESTISKINQNTSFQIDSFFRICYLKAKEVSNYTNGAFDLTVAPVVNAWGFGFDETNTADSALIDSLMQYVGYEKIKLVGDQLIKQYPQTMLDASAIAKGQGVDVASNFLEAKGVENFMVEIGGEVRVKGRNKKGELWRIGIDQPIEDPSAKNRQLQDIISLHNKSLATSGNYRQFYIKNGVKYSHTINPKTGYPARSSLLSASVIAEDCITADAFATAFMVMGLEKSIALQQTLEGIEIYLIYAKDNNELAVYKSERFGKE